MADFGTVDKLGAALTFHRERHTVLAGNVANLDTPGYRPLDLERSPAAAPVALSSDTAGQIHSATDGEFTTTFDDGGSLQGPDGNAVSLERELAKIDANRTRYAANSELVTRQFALLRYTASDGT